MEDLGFLPGVVLAIGFGIIGVLAINFQRGTRKGKGFLLRLFLYAYLLRFGMSVLLYQFGLTSFFGDFDSVGWLGGFYVHRGWVEGGFGWDTIIVATIRETYMNTARGYIYMLGLLFHLTEMPSRLGAAALNCFFGALTVVFATRISRILFSSWVAVRVGWWTCLCPSLIIWSAQTVKEPVVIFLETLALYGCVRLRTGGFSPRYIFICAMAVLLIFPFRFYAGYIAGAAVLLALIIPRLSRGKMSFASGLVLAAVLIPLIVGTGLLAQHESTFTNFDLQYIQKFRRDIAAAQGTGVQSEISLETPTGLGLATFVGAAHLLLAPFPWQMTSMRTLSTAPELVVWWWIFFLGVIPGMWYALRTRFGDVLPMMFLIIGFGLLYSVMFGNIGLIYRQRAQLLPWLLILGAVGLEQRMLQKLYKRRVRQGMALPSDGAPAPAAAPAMLRNVAGPSPGT